MDNDRKTTWAGWAVFIGLLLAAIGFTFDNNPETTANWTGVMDAFKGLGLAIGGVGGAVLGVFTNKPDRTL